MKTFFKSLFYTLFVAGILALVYSTLVIATGTNYFLVVNSDVQGKKILSKGSFWIFPEKVIPGLVTITQVEKQSLITGNINVELPYSKVLSFFDTFNIAISYSFTYNWQKDTLPLLYSQSPAVVLDKNKAIVESIIKECAIENLEKLNQETLNTAINTKINDKNISVKTHITYMPNLTQYKGMVEQIKKMSSNSTLVNNKIENALKIVEDDNMLSIKKERLSNSLNFSLDIAKKIKKENVDSKTTLEILNYLIGNNDNNSKKN